MRAATWATAASPCGIRKASSSDASGCRRCAATSASVGPSATGSSWPAASRCTPSTSRPRAPLRRKNVPARRSRRPGPDLAAQARRAGVRLVRFLYTDNGGITRGKATHVDGLAHRLTDGIVLTVAMQAMNMLDQLQSVDGLGPVGEIRLVPDPQTFTVLPYAPHAAAMTSDMCTLDGAPWEA